MGFSRIVASIASVIVCLVFFGLTTAQQQSNPVEPNQPPMPNFRVPKGFIVERVASHPLVEHPMMANFDERGRLFLAESAGENLRKDDLLKRCPNFIRCLDGRDKSGHFRTGHKFAERMTLPMGVLPYRGHIYSAAPPSLWKLTDTDGDGKADVRKELVSKFGFSGNAASIHGPFLGPDGWLYWTDGRHGHEIPRKDGTVMKGKAARIFRCRPNGDDVEVVCGGGMDDPVEIAFSAEGEPFVTVDILHNKPARNDGIIFAIEGGVYPWHPVYREFTQTGELLPAICDLGWVAPSGIMRYRSNTLGKEYTHNLFTAQFNRHRIQRHIVKRKGAGFEVRTEDFLTCDDPNFHPTDVLEDADGSLLVVDTGGWFRIGCPTSQIARPQFKGGIYRIRRKDAPAVEDPHGLKIDWPKLNAKALVKLLDDPRFLVRDRAVDTLAQRGKKVLNKLTSHSDHPSERVRRNIIWALTRMPKIDHGSHIIHYLDDKSVSVQLAAARSLGLNKVSGAADRLVKSVHNDTHPAVKREAATALGRIGNKSDFSGSIVVGLLYALPKTKDDRFLEHALIHALIQFDDPETTKLVFRENPPPSIRRGALIAIDQMKSGNLKMEEILLHLDVPDSRLQQTALNLLSKRDGGGKAIAAVIRGWLMAPKLTGERHQSLAELLPQVGNSVEISQLMADILNREGTTNEVRTLLLDAMARTNAEKLPKAWKTPIQRYLRSQKPEMIRPTLATIRTTGWNNFDEELRAVGKDKTLPNDVRLTAWATIASRLSAPDEDTFAFHLKTLTREKSPLLRLSAAETLGEVTHSPKQLARIVPLLAKAGALELPHLLAAFEKSRDQALGQRLVNALDRNPALSGLSGETLRRVLRSYPETVRKSAQPLFGKLIDDPQKRQAHLDALEARTHDGDARIGRSVFFGSKAACSACHLAKGVGGRIGPDLSKIGAIRSRRDLLESIAYPSASFVRGYESFLVETKQGKVLSGLLARESADAIFLVQADRFEKRVTRSHIASITPSRLSIMPQGLEKQLSPAEFRDLLAYLQSLK